MRSRLTIRIVFALALMVVFWALFLATRYQRRVAVVQSVQVHGGHILHDWEVDERGYCIPYEDQVPPSSSILMFLVGYDPGLDLERVWGIQFDGGPLQDADLDCLQGFPKLRGLCLDKTSITDAGLQQIAKIGTLQVLSLRFTDITDEGVNDLVKMKQLRHLDVSRTTVTQAGINRLASVPNLNLLVDYDGAEDIEVSD